MVFRLVERRSIWWSTISYQAQNHLKKVEATAKMRLFQNKPSTRIGLRTSTKRKKETELCKLMTIAP